MIYEYKCEQCDRIDEVQHGMKESPEVKCTECNSVMNRQISGGTGVIFKGNDWPTANAKMKASMIAKDAKQKKRTDHVRPVTKMSDLQGNK